MNDATGTPPEEAQAAPEKTIDPADVTSVMAAIRKGDDDEITKALSAHVQALARVMHEGRDVGTHGLKYCAAEA